MVSNCMYTKEENLDQRLTTLNQESLDALEGSKRYALLACRSVSMDVFLKIGPRAFIRLFKVPQKYKVFQRENC